MKNLVRVFTIFFLIVGVSQLFPGDVSSGDETPSSDKGRNIYVSILSNDIINPVSAEYIIETIDRAEREGAVAVVIKLDTPGGLLESTRDIVKRMMGSAVPVVVYVAPQGARAGSAGVFITLAAGVAAMAPSTNIGAAHPVSLGGDRSIGESFEDLAERLKPVDKKMGGKKAARDKKEPTAMDVKIVNDTKAWIAAIAKQRGRNVEWAMRAVTESVSVTEDEALRLGIVDFVAKDEAELLEKLDGKDVATVAGRVTLDTKGAIIISVERSLRQKILAVVAHPNIAYILLMLGLYGLLFEFTHPGAGFPGVAGAICAIVAMYGMHLLEANYAGIALIIVGIILLILEVKVVSYGLLTIGALISLVLGSLLVLNSPNEFMRVSVPIIIAFTGSTVVIAAFLFAMVALTHKRRATTGKEGLIGGVGEVREWGGKNGKVFSHGELWDAEGEGDFKVGDSVRIDGMNGIKLKIKRGD